MNWSMNRIGRLFSIDPKTAKSIYENALYYQEEENIHNLPKSRKSIDLRYIGDTSDVEYLDGDINHNVCGGGKKANEVEYER